MNDREYMNCEMDKNGFIYIEFDDEEKPLSYQEILDSSFDKLYNENYITNTLNVNDLDSNFELICRECKLSSGRVDIICEDREGNKIPIEIKKHTAGDCAIGQILGYMKSLESKNGIIVARKFSSRLVFIAEDLNVLLFYYIVRDRTKNNKFIIEFKRYNKDKYD